jgi:hypothetical protein
MHRGGDGDDTDSVQRHFVFVNGCFAPAAATQRLTPFRLYEQFANMAQQAKATRAMNIVGNQAADGRERGLRHAWLAPTARAL